MHESCPDQPLDGTGQGSKQERPACGMRALRPGRLTGGAALLICVKSPDEMKGRTVTSVLTLCDGRPWRHRAGFTCLRRLHGSIVWHQNLRLREEQHRGSSACLQAAHQGRACRPSAATRAVRNSLTRCSLPVWRHGKSLTVGATIHPCCHPNFSLGAGERQMTATDTAYLRRKRVF